MEKLEFTTVMTPLQPDICTKSAYPAVLRPVPSPVPKFSPSIVMVSVDWPTTPKPCRKRKSMPLSVTSLSFHRNTPGWSRVVCRI